jgi:exonuclease III
MKLETVNIWGGRVYKPLIEHIRQQSESVDIFCFQEVYHSPTGKKYTRPVAKANSTFPLSNLHPARADIYKQLARNLHGFTGYYRSAQMGFDYLGKVDYELYFGLSIFVRKSINLGREGEVFVYREKDSAIEGDNATLGRNLQYIQVIVNGKQFTIANLHGLWNGRGKVDAPERIEQSRKVRTFLDKLEGAKIICGDFNLLPDTKSIAILEEGGMRNLVKEHGITSTRSKYYTKPERFADYILISPDVNLIDFRVLEEAVSDHSPLLLEFN